MSKIVVYPLSKIFALYELYATEVGPPPYTLHGTLRLLSSLLT